MLRAIFMIGLFAMLGLFAVGMVFKLFGGLLALTFWVVAVALKVLIVGGVLYLGVRLVAPATAERLRDRFSGTRLTRY
jgi:sensor histidine kinase YesM